MIFTDVKKLFIPEGEVRKIECGGVLLWKGGYTNQVPLSIDTNGSIFNGKGYIDGYRLNSSGTTTAEGGTTATGYIPCTPEDTVRMAGVSWVPKAPAYYCYISFFDANFKKLAHINNYRDSAIANGVSNMTAGTVLTNKFAAHNITQDENGVWTFDLDYQSSASFAYIRISGFGAGADMIVTINEEIV